MARSPCCATTWKADRSRVTASARSAYPGEFVFVARSATADENDGWLLGLVHGLGGEITELVVLDAKDFDGEPVATVHLPAPVPMGFHGNWIETVRAG
ncbi:MAG: carotenoid oxygenase family protein [Panacagrimonas sp.]